MSLFVMIFTWNIKINVDGIWMNLGLPQVNCEAKQSASDHSGQVCTARSSFDTRDTYPEKL